MQAVAESFSDHLTRCMGGSKVRCGMLRQPDDSLSATNRSESSGIYTVEVGPTTVTISVCLRCNEVEEGSSSFLASSSSSCSGGCSIWTKVLDDATLTNHMEEDVGIDDDLPAYARYLNRAIEGGIYLPKVVTACAARSSVPSAKKVLELGLFYEIGSSRIKASLRLNFVETCRTNIAHHMMNAMFVIQNKVRLIGIPVVLSNCRTLRCLRTIEYTYGASHYFCPVHHCLRTSDTHMVQNATLFTICICTS